MVRWIAAWVPPARRDYLAAHIDDIIKRMAGYGRRIFAGCVALLAVLCAVITLTAIVFWARSYFVHDRFALDMPGRCVDCDSWEGAATLTMCRPLTRGISETTFHWFTHRDGGLGYSQLFHYASQHSDWVYMEFHGIAYLYAPFIGPEPTAEFRLLSLPYWLIDFIAAPLPAWWFWAMWRRRARRKREAPAPSTEPGSIVLELDTPCARCGYNLRGLKPIDNCPECGLGVQRSLLIGKTLPDSRPAWVASIARGSQLLVAAQLLPVVAIAGAAMAEAAELGATSASARIVILLLAAATYAVGSWLLTRPENPYASNQPYRKRSLALRFCASALFLGGLLLAGGALLGQYQAYVNSSYDSAWMDDAAPYVIGVLVVCFLPCPLLQFLIMKRLAQRVLNRHLTEHTAIVGIGHPLSVLAPVVLFAIVRVDPLNRWDFWMILVVWVAFLLFWIWCTYVHILFAIAFRRAIRPAAEAWRAADAAAEQQPLRQ